MAPIGMGNASESEANISNLKTSLAEFAAPIIDLARLKDERLDRLEDRIAKLEEAQVATKK